ncbi:substrate-binding domain-containing protein [Motilimonas eburnea]|uniref:substrate-binding domain-containing protein n=1 Tax=Motilimonas eburnea TaxID=1737488 RepID=UPI001E44008D|nr:substrate-binding domain-containing protein [Motilimonas eburnea]MCE2572006.1 substrate-binding domain-containing protein [Motilimonas eburnea]
MVRILFRLFGFYLLFSASAFAASMDQPKILIVPKGMSLTFWQVVESGVKKASNELNQPVIWRGPYNDNDLNSQIAIIRNYLNSNVEVLAVAAIDAHLITPFIMQYQRRGKRVLVFDSQAIGANPMGFIASNNYQAGKRLVESIATQFRGDVHALIVQNDAGHASTEERLVGFQDQLKHYGITSLTLIEAGSTKGSALHATYAALVADPRINMVLAVNEATTEGAALAIKKLKRGNTLLAGFDINDGIYRLLHDDVITQLVVQDPYAMGYQVMQQANMLLKGEQIAPTTEVPIRLIDKASLADPETNAFIRHFLKVPK